ncbi:hypothetical protein BFW01_g8624 [Lasiodiplodia theobromae]|nr:hypothetical protein BFW01_g8624 [Lasiodiplodia theobromae]
MASARASSSSSSVPTSISGGYIETTWSGPSLTLPPEDLQSSTASMQANTKLARRADAPCLPSPGLQYTTSGKTFRIICGADNNVNSFHSAPAANPKECADLCVRQQGCAAASYTSACWFKDKIGVVQSSGVAGSATNTQEQNLSEIKENDPSPPDSDRPEFTFVQDDQQQDQPDQNQQQTTQQGQNQQTSSQQAQNPQSTDAPKQENNQQGQGDGPSEITENGPSPESDDRPEFTFVQEDGQQDQQQTQQNQQAQQSTQPQSQPTQQPTQQQDQGPSDIKENDPSPADSDRPEFTFVQEDSAQDQQQNQQQNQQDQQQTQQGQTQNQQNQQQQEQNPSEIKETDPNRESDDRPEFTFVEDNQSGQQGQEQSQQQASQTQQPQQSPSQPQQEQNPTEIKETDPNRLSDDFPEFTFLEGQFINKMKRWFDYYPKAYRV